MRVLLLTLVLLCWSSTLLAESINAKIKRCNEAGEPQRRIETCTQLLTAKGFSTSDRAHIFNNRGIAYEKIDEFDKAVADYDQAISLKPDFSWAYHNRGIVHRRQGDLDKAIADHTEALRLDPNFAEAFNSRGNAYAKQGQYDRAIADFVSALKLQPEYPEALYNRAGAYRVKGDDDLAIADYDKLLRQKPKDADALTSRGVVRFNKGVFQEAEADFEKAADIDQDDAYPRLYLWLARARQGNRDDAVLTDFIEEYSGKSDDWPLLLIKFAAGKVGERELLAAAQGSSTTAIGRRCEALFYSGEIALIRGDRGKARELFESAMSTNVVDFWEYSSARSELARLQ